MVPDSTPPSFQPGIQSLYDSPLLVSAAYEAAAIGIWPYSKALEVEFLSLAFPAESEVASLRAVGAGVGVKLSTFVKAANVRFLPNRRFDFHGAGQRAMVVAVRDIRGEVVDMLAWPAAESRNWAVLEGNGFALGEENLARGVLLQEPVKVHRSVLDWLRAGGKGIVILAPRKAWSRLAGILEVEDRRHAFEINRILSPPRPAVRLVVGPVPV